MSRSLAAGAGRMLMLARHPRPALRRPMSDSPGGVAAKQDGKAQLGELLEKMDAELQVKLYHQVDAYRQMPTYANDRGYVNRVLTFCRVPKGEPRRKLIWRSNVTAAFLGSMVVGQWLAHRCTNYHYGLGYEQEEKTANHAV